MAGQMPGMAGQGMAGQMQKQMAQGKMAGLGGAAAPGGTPGGADADSGPADFNTPEGAVRSFLNALKAKDLDRLNESTSQRASSDVLGASSTKNREIFKKIIDLSLSDSDLDDLAKKLEGFAVASRNPQKSTGKMDVVVRKAGEHGAYILRKVTVRREKNGWHVFDIGSAEVFKTQGVVQPRKRAQ